MTLKLIKKNQSHTKKKKIPSAGYLLSNLNLIVDRPDGLNKEGKNLYRLIEE
jgi:hypothetical protein